MEEKDELQNIEASSQEETGNELVQLIVLSNGKQFPRKTYSQYTKDELIEIIGCCKNIKDMIDTLRINNYYHTYIVNFINNNNIDTSHFIREKRQRIDMNAFVKNSRVTNTKSLKMYLLKHNIVEHKCSVCNLLPIWNNIPLMLQLDHVNGDHYDNRIENLRLICPNCHSQTDTYTGRNVKQYEDKHCSGCNKKLKTDNVSLKCADCIQKDAHICTICKVRKRVVNNSKCTPCSKLHIEPQKCKGCGEVLKKATTTSGYHKRCYKLSKPPSKEDE